MKWFKKQFTNNQLIVNNKALRLLNIILDIIIEENISFNQKNIIRIMKAQVEYKEAIKRMNNE